MSAVTEGELERAALEWFAELGYEVLDAENLAPTSVYEERSTFDEVVLRGRLDTALRHLNPSASEEAIQEAVRLLHRRDAPTLVQNNEDFHRMLTDGIGVEVAAKGGDIRGVQLRLFDFDRPSENDWMVASQMVVVDREMGTGRPRRLDLVVFVNGLPLAVLELKNPSAQGVDVWDAYQQLQTYKKDIPALFATNCVLAISDDVHARIGSLTAPASRFGPWRTVDGEDDAPASAQPLEVLIRGVFEKSRFLDFIRNFITFEVERGEIVKKLAGYHQFHAVRRAVVETVRAAGKGGDRRIGVIWHTQGSGKSLSMVFYAGKLILDHAMENPTIVVLTDRNDLDDQLFATFSHAQALLRQKPQQAAGRAELKELLQTASGGVYFTTVQKFLPEPGQDYPALSERRNIVVIADEAHRSQYGFKGRVDRKSGEIVYGFAKHLRDALPNASFIGFTGTPLELEDKSTIQVFGDYISIYDIRRAVEDHATVPIYYENRLAKIELDEAEKPRIDAEFEEVTEGEEVERREELKSEWSALEKLVGTEKRIRLIAEDIVKHFERRRDTLKGKALVVCMSRRICVDLYAAIVRLRPDWDDDDLDSGTIKVVMTGSAADPEGYKPHIRSKKGRERLADRFRDPADPLQVVIVRDMWLTGFDAPSLHTLYVDKPMRGHNLMQAIARVNRVFGDKPGGLVVDYIGIAPFLREAMANYTRSGGQGDATARQEQAVAAMLERLELCRDLFHGFDYSGFFSGSPRKRLALLPAAREYMLAKRMPRVDGAKGKQEPDDYDRFLDTVGKLSSAFALAMPHEECENVRDEVAFFQAVKVGLVKLAAGKRGPREALDHAIRQIVSNAIVSDEVIDVFGAAGLEKPDISILDDRFLAEVRDLDQKNVAVELLRRLLSDEVRSRSRRSVIQARSFAEMLEAAVRRYQNRSIETAEVIEELIALAKKIRDADKKGDELKLSKDEFAFYEALADNDSAKKVLGDDNLASMARELADLVRKNTTIDWQHKSSAQARLRVLVKKLLKRHGYPPDAAKKATDTVIEQAKVLGINIVEGGSDSDAAPGPWSEPDAGHGTPAASLPFPIEVFDGMVESKENPTLRVKTRLDGIEKVLAFVVATELATLTELAGGSRPKEVDAILGDDVGKPLSMGKWLEYAWKFARLLPPASTDPIVRAARAFITKDGKQSILAKRLTQAVEYRNLFSHSVTPSEAAVAEKEAPLHELWRDLKGALAPLADSRLVSRAAILDFGQGGVHRYKLRQHQGPNSLFPVKEEDVKGELRDEWCYLLRDGKPLALAPIVLCSRMDPTDPLDVFLGRAIAFTPGTKVDMFAVTSASKKKVAVP